MFYYSIYFTIYSRSINSYFNEYIAVVIFRRENVQVVARPAMLNEQYTDVTISRTLDVRQYR